MNPFLTTKKTPCVLKFSISFFTHNFGWRALHYFYFFILFFFPTRVFLFHALFPPCGGPEVEGARDRQGTSYKQYSTSELLYFVEIHSAPIIMCALAPPIIVGMIGGEVDLLLLAACWQTTQLCVPSNATTNSSST